MVFLELCLKTYFNITVYINYLTLNLKIELRINLKIELRNEIKISSQNVFKISEFYFII